MDRKFNHPLGNLPEDDLIWVVIEAGRVDYLGSNRSEPVWPTTLSPLIDGRLDVNQTIKINLGASLYRHAPILSVWKNQAHIGFVGEEWPDILHCDFSDQRILYRESKEVVGIPSFFELESESRNPYILFKVNGLIGIDYGIVRSQEISRYYYGYLTSVSRNFFNFDKNCDNPNLFNSRYTLRINHNTFQIDPTSRMSDQDQARLCVYLNSKVARLAISSAAFSARALSLKFNDVRPVFRVPVSGRCEWRVVGRPLDIVLNREDNVSEMTRVFAVSRIQSCGNPSDIRYVDSLRVTKRRQTRKDRRGYSTPIFRPAKRKSDIPVVSDIPPGTQTSNPEDIFSPPARARDAWANLVLLVKHKNKEGKSGAYEVLSAADIDKMTTMQGSGGEDGTGTFNSQDDEPSEKYHYTLDPDHGRDESVHIFDNIPDGDMTKEDVLIGVLPDNFQYFIRGVIEYVEEHPHISCCFRGGNGRFYPDVIPVFHMNKEWGPGARYRHSPNGVLRGIVFQISTRDGFVYFFDLEPRTGQSVAIHCMLINGQRQLSEDQLKTIFYLRSCGSKRGWPGRSQYAGDFWTESMYHYDVQEGNTCGDGIIDHIYNLRSYKVATEG